MRIRLTLNGAGRDLDVEPLERALDLLRRIGLTGTKEGCGEGECGSCTIMMNGAPVNSCLVIASQLDGADIITVEGLGSDRSLSALQSAFITHGATQCGFCTPGILIAAEYMAAELARAPDAGTGARFDVDAIRAWASDGSRPGGQESEKLEAAVEREIRACLGGNICRCTGYDAIVRAVKDVLRDAVARSLQASVARSL